MDLNTYLSSYLGDDLTLQFSVTGSLLNYVVDESLADYGVTDESLAIDSTKIHKIAIMELWKRLMVGCSSAFDVSLDGSSYKTSQLYDFCNRNYLNAYCDALPYLDAGVITVDTHRLGGHKHDEEFSFRYWPYG
jgi:hypothetical protein